MKIILISLARLSKKKYALMCTVKNQSSANLTFFFIMAFCACGETMESWQTFCVDCFTAAAEIATPRECEVCKEPSLLSIDPAWRKKCSECFMKAKTELRKCIVCGALNIDGNRQSWMKKCKDCYTTSRNLTHKMCSTCPPSRHGRLTLPMDRPAPCRLCKREQAIRKLQKS